MRNNLLKSLLVVGIVWFLAVGIHAAVGGRRMKNGAMKPRHRVVGNVGIEKHSRALSKFDLNYTSKRKIPNGPDPIHNRRAGNSRQPPGQA